MIKYEMLTYDHYKDCELKGLDKVPSHWGYLRVKEVCEVKGRIGFRGYNKEDLVNEGEGALLIGASEIHINGFINIDSPKYISWFKYFESPEIMLCPGDLVIAQRGSTIGKTALIPDNIGKATINPTLVLLKKIKKINKKYLLYFLMSPIMQDYINSQIASTAIPMISQQQIGNYIILYPPLLEQNAIVDYLDIRTAVIDRKIQLLTQKADKYRELKQSLINEAVTQGLDKTVMMKDCGVKWIGEVPAHWEIKRLKDLLTERSQKGFPEEPLLIASQDKGVTLKSSYSRNTMTVQKDFHLMKLVKKNDFVISLRSFEGGIEIAMCRGIISAAYTILFAKEERLTGFYRHLFKSNKFISMLVTCTTGIREGRNVNYQQLKRELLPLPSLEECQQIAVYLDTKTAHIDRIIETINSQIENLKELRKTLINDIVTGKIKATMKGEVI